MIQRHGLPSSHPSGPQRGPRHRTRLLVSTAVTTWSLELAPGFAVAVAPGPSHPIARVADGTPDDLAGVQPSIQYEEALAHAGDRLDLAPGERVAIPFTPRASDAWSVDGGAPVELPAGRLDGGALRREATGNPGDGGRAAVPASSVDQPTAGVATVRATLTSWSPTGPTTTTKADAAVGTTLSREVFGFLPYWELGSSTLRIDARKISTIAYFGLGADASGNLQKTNADGTTSVGWSGWTSANLTNVINTAHQNHTRVVLTVQSFAWNTSGQTR